MYDSYGAFYDSTCKLMDCSWHSKEDSEYGIRNIIFRRYYFVAVYMYASTYHRNPYRAQTTLPKVVQAI